MWLYIVHYLSAAKTAKHFLHLRRTVRIYISSCKTSGDVEPRTYIYGPPKLFEQIRSSSEDYC